MVPLHHRLLLAISGSLFLCCALSAMEDQGTEQPFSDLRLLPTTQKRSGKSKSNTAWASTPATYVATDPKALYKLAAAHAKGKTKPLIVIHTDCLCGQPTQQFRELPEKIQHELIWMARHPKTKEGQRDVDEIKHIAALIKSYQEWVPTHWLLPKSLARLSKRCSIIGLSPHLPTSPKGRYLFYALSNLGYSFSLENSLGSDMIPLPSYDEKHTSFFYKDILWYEGEKAADALYRLLDMSQLPQKLIVIDSSQSRLANIMNYAKQRRKSLVENIKALTEIKLQLSNLLTDLSTHAPTRKRRRLQIRIRHKIEDITKTLGDMSHEMPTSILYRFGPTKPEERTTFMLQALASLDLIKLEATVRKQQEHHIL